MSGCNIGVKVFADFVVVQVHTCSLSDTSHSFGKKQSIGEVVESTIYCRNYDLKLKPYLSPHPQLLKADNVCLTDNGVTL